MDLTTRIVSLLLLLTSVLVAADQHDDIHRRVEMLEKQFGVKVTELERRVVKLEAVNEMLVKENDENKARIAALTRQVEESRQGEHKGKSKVSVADAMTNMDAGKVKTHEHRRRVSSRMGDIKDTLRTPKVSMHNRALSDNTNIAFTAYADHDLNNQGPNQVLVYSRVLLNHGGGYDHTTGVFTAPVSGVYSFSFFIGQRDVNQFLAYLVINNERTVDAIAETAHATQDLQGGNVVNVLVTKGDRVFVKHAADMDGDHVEADHRFTTFSGFLVYPVDTGVVVVG